MIINVSFQWQKQSKLGYSNPLGSWPLLMYDEIAYNYTELVRLIPPLASNETHLIGLPGVYFRTIRYEDNQLQFWQRRRRNGDKDCHFEFGPASIGRASLWVLYVPIFSCTPRRGWPSPSFSGDPEYDYVQRLLKRYHAVSWK